MRTVTSILWTVTEEDAFEEREWARLEASNERDNLSDECLAKVLSELPEDVSDAEREKIREAVYSTDPAVARVVDAVISRAAKQMIHGDRGEAAKTINEYFDSVTGWQSCDFAATAHDLVQELREAKLI